MKNSIQNNAYSDIYYTLAEAIEAAKQGDKAKLAGLAVACRKTAEKYGNQATRFEVAEVGYDPVDEEYWFLTSIP